MRAACGPQLIEFNLLTNLVLLSSLNVLKLCINKFLILQFPLIAIRTSKVAIYRAAHGYINTAAYNCCGYLMRRRRYLLSYLQTTLYYMFDVHNKCKQLLFTVNKRRLKFT